MSEPALPGPTGNPFIAQRIRPGELPYLFPQGASAAAVVEEFRRHGGRGAIIGPHGSGKSTLLRTLMPQFEAAGNSVLLLELHDGQRRLPPLAADAAITAQTVIVVDGYEQLSRCSRWLLRWRAWRSGCGLLATAHRPVDLPTLFTTRTDPGLAVEIVRRLEAVQGKPSGVSDAEIAGAFASQEGNIREMLFALYDLYRARMAAGDR